MKDVFRKYLILVLVLALLFAHMIPARAESSLTFTEKIETKNDVVFYEIAVTPGSNICGLSLEIKYSEEQVKINKCAAGDALAGGIVKSNCAVQGKVFVSYISITPMEAGGSVVLLEFEALTTDNKKIDIDCNITECIDQECNEIAYTYNDAEILNPKYAESTSNTNDDDPDDPTGNDQDHQTEPDNSGNEANKPDEDHTVSNENVTGETITSKPPSDPQDDPTTTQPTQDQNETISGETTPLPDNHEDTLNSGESETVTNSTEGLEETEKQTSQDDDEQGKDMDRDTERGPKYWPVIVSVIGLTALLAVIYLTVVKPILSKRGNNNERK